MEAPLPQPPRPFQGAPPPPSSSNSNSNSYSFTAPPARVGSILLSASPITIPIFSKELDLASVANPQKHSTIKQYLFGLLLFKPLLALLLDCFSLVFLSAWVSGSAGKGNSSGLVIYALATTGSIGIMIYGGWRASQVLRKGNIQGIFVTREAYRFVCLTSRDKFLFFERVGQGYGKRDALVYFTWFTLRDWMQHLLCDLPRLVINCTILGQVAHQKSLVNQGLPPTLNMPELTGLTHFVLACNIMLQLCNLFQFLGALVVLAMVRKGKLISLRKDEYLHTYCQRNLNVRVVRLFKLAKTPGGGTGAPLRQHDQLAQQMGRYRADEEAGIGPEGGIDLSLASLAWDTETQDEGIDYNHYAYRARPISTGPPPRTGSNNERIEMTENPISATGSASAVPGSSLTGAPPPPPSSYPAPVPGSFSYAQVQHLQRMREKYGDNRELYEPMEWKPPVPPSDVAPSAPRQSQLQQQQNNNNNYYNNNNHNNTRVDF
ncbi:hypothetical protein F5H01DRAFT_346531 [Linnemannia elongata]|nr:hypothetical protein F5H01DRAFT_346531 [Linnemannia elongata]